MPLEKNENLAGGLEGGDDECGPVLQGFFGPDVFFHIKMKETLIRPNRGKVAAGLDKTQESQAPGNSGNH